jgi:hypothetical protein
MAKLFCIVTATRNSGLKFQQTHPHACSKGFAACITRVRFISAKSISPAPAQSRLCNCNLLTRREELDYRNRDEQLVTVCKDDTLNSNLKNSMSFTTCTIFYNIVFFNCLCSLYFKFIFYSNYHLLFYTNLYLCQILSSYNL